MKKLNSTIILVFSFILILGTSCSSYKTPDQSAGEYSKNSRTLANSELDLLFDEFKSLFDSELSEARKAELKIIQENLLKYLIEATHGKDSYKIKIYNDASNYFNKIYPVFLENIRNEKKGSDKLVAINRAPLWTLKDELDFLNAEVSKLPEPKIKLDLLDGLKLMSPLYHTLGADKKAAVASIYDKAAIKVLGSEFNLHPTFPEIEEIVESSGSDNYKILKIIELVENKLKKHELSIRNVGTEIAKSGQVDLKNTQIRLVVKFMDYYFNKLPDDVIKTIMSELVTAGPKMTQEAVMTTIFQNTGPGMGKVMQQIGKENGVGDGLSGMMSVLENSGKEVPIHLVERVVNTDVGGFEIKSITAKRLGTGTIAQVNKAVLVHEDVEKTVALRFLKPGVTGRCKEDIAILRRFVPENEELLKAEGFKDIKMMGTLIDSVEKFLIDEVDLNLAVQRQKKAHEIYTRSVKISAHPDYHMLEMKVPEVYVAPKGSSNLHIQEFVTGGVKFGELTDGAAKKIVSEELLRMWFEEALFKSGYLNADLHPGNFRIVLIEESNKIKILIYDFGMSSTLTKEDQRAFILLGAGAYLKSPSTIADALMASMNSKDKSVRAALMKDIEAELKVNPKKKPEEWVVWCVQKNYFVSENLGSFGRGSRLLKLLPESFGETEMFKEVIIKTASKNLVRAISDRHYDYPLTKIDMAKLAAISAKNSCKEMIQSFFKFFGGN